MPKKGKGIANIFGSVRKTAGKITNTIIHGKKELPNNVNHVLRNVGDAIIHHIRVGRTVVPSAITGTLNVFSNVPYDKLFHLFMIMETSKGNVLLEKNEIINMSINPNIKAEYIDISRSPSISVSEFVTKTERFMGGKFIPYSAYNNNCQDFILSALQANDIHEGKDFIKQDTKTIFENHPNLRKFAHTVTDISARVNNVFQGGSIKPNKASNGMSSDDINKILRRRRDYGGCYSKNSLPKQLKKDFWYIANMQNYSEGGGTHWVVFKYSTPFLYFDAFGIIPPLEICEKSKGDIFYSDKQIQNVEKSTCCGWYCIACILSDDEWSIDPLIHFRRFLVSFSFNTLKNDYILKHILDRLL